VAVQSPEAHGEAACNPVGAGSGLLSAPFGAGHVLSPSLLKMHALSDGIITASLSGDG